MTSFAPLLKATEMASIAARINTNIILNIFQQFALIHIEGKNNHYYYLSENNFLLQR
jgi:hypothetical protein